MDFPAAIAAKFAAVKLIIFDIDGVMTDGKLYFADHGETMKAFHSRDGLGIKMLLQSGIQVGVITGRESQIVATRAKELGIQHVYQGQVNKLVAFEQCRQQLHIEPQHIAYMGDDINDLPILKIVGLSLAPANAAKEVLQVVDWRAQNKGGYSAVREACDLILHTQNKWQTAIKIYGN